MSASRGMLVENVRLNARDLISHLFDQLELAVEQGLNLRYYLILFGLGQGGGPHV